MNIDVWNTILNMPFTKDRKSKIELAFYSELIPDLYMSGLVPQLYLSAAQSTQHCLSGGMDESVIYSFSIMGLQLGEQEEFKPAYKYEDLARDLSAKYPNTFGATRGMNGIVWCNMHSRSHPREIVDYCLKSIQCGKNCGDLYNAGLSYGPLMWNLQVQGVDLSMIDDYAKECLQFSNRYHLSFSAGLAEAMQAGWIEPMKKNYSPIPMEEKIKQWEQNNHIASAGSYYVHMAMVHYYFGEHEEAERYLNGVQKYLSGLTDNVLKRQWHVFRVLNALKLYRMGIGFTNEDQLLAEIQPIIEKVEKWADLGPLLKPYLAFIYAELERVTGEVRATRSLYLDAINIAHEQGYTFLEGHLNECLGEFLQRVGQSPARIYLVEAARLYRECHAERKEIRIMEKYPTYFEEEKIYPSLEVESPAYTLPDLDIEYLMKSSLAISAEIEQEALLRKILNLVIVSSGAQHGYLLIGEEGNLFVRAESHGAEKEAVRICNKKLEDADGVCKAIVRYVYRTSEELILNNAAQEGGFKDNPEVQNMQLRSILCLPVIKQSKIIGILYLENRLLDSAFTSGKTEMTKLLTSQAAISLENATLFEYRKKAEDALRKSEQRWATTLASIGDAVIATDTACRITFMNAVAETLTGWTLREASQKPVKKVFNILDERTRLEVEDPVTKVLEKGTINSLANRTILVRKDGKEVAIDDSGAPIRGEDGRLMGVVLVFRDITERRKAEQAMLGAEAKYRELSESINEIFFAMDTSLRCTYWNKASEAFTGILAKDAIGKSLYELFYQVKGTKVEEMFMEALKTQQPKRLDTEYQIGSKKSVFEFNAYPTKTGLSIIAKDIGDRKRLEAQLIRAQRSESLGQLANGIAHDLNNILAPIMMSLALLREEVKDDTGQTVIDTIEKSAQRGADLVKQVQSFSQGIEGERKGLQVAEIIAEAGQIAKETFPKKIDFRTSAAKNLRGIFGDPTQLHQVLMNLLVNARDAMPDGGILTISAENAYIDETYARMHIDAKVGPYIVITVSDTGIGIPPEIMDRVFDPFFTTKEFGKGTGLGLSTALTIMKSHGGFMNVQSEVGKGSTFKVYLPAFEKSEAQKIAAEDPETPTGRGETVLVVDDEAAIREITCSTLQKYGYKVLTASDGAEAIAVYTKNRSKVRVVLMDLLMPSVDGQASIQVLRRINPKAKIIAVSGLVEKDRYANVKELAQALLPKPYTAEKLLETVHKVLSA